MKIEEKRYPLPIKEVAQPPPFKDLLLKCKTENQIEKVLEQVKDYWYSKGLSDMAKMYEKVIISEP